MVSTANNILRLMRKTFPSVSVLLSELDFESDSYKSGNDRRKSDPRTNELPVRSKVISRVEECQKPTVKQGMTQGELLKEYVDCLQHFIAESQLEKAVETLQYFYKEVFHKLDLSLSASDPLPDSLGSQVSSTNNSLSTVKQETFNEIPLDTAKKSDKAKWIENSESIDSATSATMELSESSRESIRTPSSRGTNSLLLFELSPETTLFFFLLGDFCVFLLLLNSLAFSN